MPPSSVTCSIEPDGLAYETRFHGRRGRFTTDGFPVGYGRGSLACSATMENIKTGSTSHNWLPRGQPLS
ncbi:MAG: hypothetical protein QW057_08280 [Candidatus Bathyarchaeia archaeon]